MFSEDQKILLVVVVQSLSCVRLFATPWTVSHQFLLSSNVSQFAQIRVHGVGDALLLVWGSKKQCTA